MGTLALAGAHTQTGQVYVALIELFSNIFIRARGIERSDAINVVPIRNLSRKLNVLSRRKSQYIYHVISPLMFFATKPSSQLKLILGARDNKQNVWNFFISFDVQVT